MLDLDAAIAARAGDRLGIISLDECRDLGASWDFVKRRLCSGLLTQLHLGVYRHAAAPESFEGNLRAAVLAAGPEAWASGPSAMRLYGIRGEWSETPEVTVLGAETHLLDGVRVRRIDRIDERDVTRRFGIPVLAPPLALLLLGSTASERKVETAVHDTVHLRLTVRPKLIDVLDRFGGRGRRGTAKFRVAVRHLPADGTATERNLELDLLRLLRLHGLPEPHVQYRVIDAVGRKRRLDLAYPDDLLDVETDGDRWHTNPHDRASDRRRDKALEALGWEVQRYGSNDVHVWPERTVDEIRRSLSTGGRSAPASRQRTK